ncbi:copii coat assembly protein sec16 [Acrodontium crateriforme]|uniref:Protein transport protein sec16 n=1 Tax=Acrodontium crateriforme TaxID=150365 RepID=A0AAQ3M4I1_9PEZI|nr:copii coat assembly protein sec16 [Acrodontium crateriforme]
MNEDDYPDFGSAFPSTIVSLGALHASWNPALRPNSHQSPAVTHAARSTNADDGNHIPREDLIEESKDSAHRDSPVNTDELPEILPRKRSSISIERVFGVRQEAASPDQPLLESQYSADAEGPLSKSVPMGEDEDDEFSAWGEDEKPVEEVADPPANIAADEEEAEVNAWQEDDEEIPEDETSDPPIHILAPGDAEEEIVSQTNNSTGIIQKNELEEHPEVNYEHQGDLTDMDKAIDESVKTPLMQDEAPLPTPGLMSREPTFNSTNVVESESMPSQQNVFESEPLRVSLGRSFTSNFTSAPEPSPEEQEQQISTDSDWPAVGDDKTFGELLDNEKAPSPEEASESHYNDGAQSHGWLAAEEDEAFGELLKTQSRMPAQEMLHEQPSSPLRNDEWPEVGDDNAFGELLEGDSTHQKDIASDSPHELTEDGDLDDDLLPDDLEKEDDLAAAWGAALDDDDLLDDIDEDGLLDDDELLKDDEADPARFFADDGDSNFLEDEIIADSAKVSAPQQQRYRPTNATSSNPYAPANSPVPGQAHGRSAGTPDTGLFDLYNSPPASQQQFQQPPQGRTVVTNAQSFADKAKGGYESPYDLPMEVVKPRRRAPQQQQIASNSIAPPRSSSFSLQSAPQIPSQTPVQSGRGPPSKANQSTPTATEPVARSIPPSTPATNGANPPAKSSPASTNGFFAELPMTVKPRSRPSGGYTPQSAPTPTAGTVPTQRPAAQATPSSPQQTAPYGLGLRQPDRLPLLPDQPDQPSSVPVQAVSTPSQNARYSPKAEVTRAPPSNRYSPAPAASSAGPIAGPTRYSPAPAAAPSQARTRYPSGSVAVAPHAFAPRTSSPLAYQTDKPHPPLPSNVVRSMTASPPSLGPMPSQSVGNSPDRRSSTTRYDPSGQANVTSPPQVSSPQRQIRSRTQSPGAAIKQSKLAMTNPEPRPLPAGISLQSTRPALPHRRQLSRELTFMAPQDERAQDPLQRWKGHPIFKWNAGGSIISSFPKQTPYYAAGHGIPSVKCTPGDVTLQDAAALIPLDDRNAKFPGPLPARSKGKKKELIAWLNGKVEDLERQTEGVLLDFSIDSDLRKRAEEKLILWKIVKIFVEHDGALENNQKIEEEVRKVLLPNLEQMSQKMEVQTPGPTAAQVEPIDRAVIFQLRQALLEGHRERAVWLAEEKKLWGHALLIASTMSPDTWKQIVQSFVRSQVKTVGSDARSLAAAYQVFAGNSEECVDELVPPSARAGFQMVSKDLGTASGNPLDGLDQWRETLCLVVNNRTNNDGASLLSLGKLLAGYGRVEAAHTCFMFARASVKSGGPDDSESNFTLLGANHQSQDENFGNDLDSIILTEIYEWASSLTVASTGAPYLPHLQAFKLIHAQKLAVHGLKSKAQSYCEHITSAYTSTTRPSGYYHPNFTQAVTDLGAYLSQAPQDGKSGFFSKPAMNKVSSGAASWFTKFVAGDEDQANVVGDQAFGGPIAAGPFGGVGGVSSEVVSLSRPQSTTNLYNPLMNDTTSANSNAQPTATPTYAALNASSKYAPSSYTPTSYTTQPQAQVPRAAAASRYTPQAPNAPSQPAHSSPSFTLSGPQSTNASADAPEAPKRYSLEQKSLLPVGYQPPVRTQSGSSRYAPSPATQNLGGSYHPSSSRAGSDYAPSQAPSSRRGSAQYPESHHSGSYEPVALSVEETPSYGYQPPQPETQADDAEDPFGRPNGVQSDTGFDEGSINPEEGGYMPPVVASYNPKANGYEPPSTSYEPVSSGYEAPSTSYEPVSGGYEPPTTGYQPYEPEPDSPEDAEEAPKPKKKSFMDDEDDDVEELARRAAALKKAQADREADDAFRKAAEADAARDGSKGGIDKNKPGWFGGWFGKKDPNNLAGGGAAPGPIRAKLGEESSFYYDEQLKKWVNKKGGSDSATPVSATPPPPRGAPSRAASAVMGPPSGPPSRVASTSGIPPSIVAAMGNRPPTSAGPPSRTSTPALQDIGAPGFPPMGAGNMASGPPSRPGTSMSTASSLDDLLGGPPGGGRKSGGTMKKKKGGRYVDVMAK